MHQSIRIHFRKKGVLKFISHQDTMRLFEKGIRRSGLPIRMSEGFNPKPQFAYLLALGVGIESDAEIVTLRMAEWTRTRDLTDRLAANLPDGIEIVQATIAPPKAPPIASSVSYSVVVDDPTLLATDEQIEQLLASDTVLVTRRRKGKLKEVNLRPFIRTITRQANQIAMTFDVTLTGTANPIEVLICLGADDETVRTQMAITRTDLS